MKCYDPKDVEELVLCECGSEETIVRDCNDPPGIIGIVYCKDCGKELGTVWLGFVIPEV